MKIKIAPSILSADFGCLADEVKKIERAGADLIHIDVMDGHFVPNITIGPVVVKYLKKYSSLPLDVHLMIENAGRFVEPFVSAGSDMITFHIEAMGAAAIKKQAAALRKKGVRVGVSLNPTTPLSKLKNVLGTVDFVLVMTVNPGFGGQQFIPGVIAKIKSLRGIFDGGISVDGGVNNTVAGKLLHAGADILVSGSYIFGAKDTKRAIDLLRNA